MLSRRSFIAGLLAMPAVVHASNLMSLKGVKLAMRNRGWLPVLEPDGSVALAKGADRYLDEWLSTQTPASWGEETRIVNLTTEELVSVLQTPSLQVVASQIKQDKLAYVERVEHWKGFMEFQKTKGVTVDAFMTEPGAQLRNDPPQPPARPVLAYTPCFQYFRKDEVIVLPPGRG